VLGDRFGVRRVMIACDAAMVLVMATLAIGATRGVPLWSLLLVGALSGTVAAMRRPAEGVFPRLFHHGDELAKRMALVGGCLQVARVTGPVAGGVLVATGGLPMTAAVDAGSFAVVLVVLLLVRPPREADQVPTAPGRGWRAIADGLATASRTPGVPGTVAAVVLLAASVLPLVMLCVPVAGRDRGWSAGFVGLVAAAWVAGGLLVSLVVARRGAPPRRVAAAGPLASTAAVAVFATYDARWAAVGALFVVGVGTAVFTAHLLPAFVERTPPDMLARFQSLLGIAQTGPVLLVTPLLGALASHAGIAAGLVVVAVPLALSSVPLVAPVGWRPWRHSTRSPTASSSPARTDG
jgi:hypothetical protein